MWKDPAQNNKAVNHRLSHKIVAEAVNTAKMSEQ